LSVPNRKIRNQPANRIHDIEFAAEISTSLISQVRNLQSLLAEKEEELRDVKTEKSRLEIEAEGFQQRVKTLDESEHRYKDENWNLETQIHELIATQKEAAEREKKLSQNLNILQADKNSTQRELDEVKLSHSKLAEEHAATVKHHDIELGTAKRNIVMAESERSAMQRKIDDLTSQNQELAKAFSSQRGRLLEREQALGMSDEDFDTANDNVTPEHSPPPSPVKGTPRHSMLETETLKSSLHHAQRMLQSQRGQLHREKTEKLELKRLLQDARDEMDRLRNDGSGVSNRRSRKMESKEFKKPPRLLGGLRSSRSEIHLDDPDWEEIHDGTNPQRSSAAGPSTHRDDLIQSIESSDQFETANETSDAAFETANERGTETEDFQTGAEEFSDSEDVQTETESPSRGPGRVRRPPSLGIGLNQAGNRESFHSTASTSNDEDFDFTELRTPTSAQPQKMRLRISRNPLARRSRQFSEEPIMQSSPTSFANSSAAGTPQQAGQSLFAELADLDGSDDESMGMTPGRMSRSVTPGSAFRSPPSPPPAVPALPSLIMVDSGVMTDPIKTDLDSSTPTSIVAPPPRPQMVDCGVMTEESMESPPISPVSVVHVQRPTSMESIIDTAQARPSSQFLGLDDATDGHNSRPLSSMSYSDAEAQHDPDMEEKLARFPAPPSSPSRSILPLPPTLSFSSVLAQDVQPKAAETRMLPPPPTLSLTPLVSVAVEPKAALAIPPPTLSFTNIHSQAVEPKAEPIVALPRAPTLSISGIKSEFVEPREEPNRPPPPMPSLSISNIKSEFVEPREEAARPAPPLPSLSMSNIKSEFVEPKEAIVLPPPPPPVLSISAIQSEGIEPKAELPPVLKLTGLVTEAVEPKAEPEVVVPVPVLTLTTIQSEGVEPITEPLALVPEPPVLGYSNIKTEHVVPIPVCLPPLSLSSILTEDIEPVTLPMAKPVLPHFNFSPIESIETRPVSPRSPKRDGFIIPRDLESPFGAFKDPQTPTSTLFGSLLGRGKNKGSSTPIIAEDETRQSPRDTPQPETPESQRPFKEISSNSNVRPPRKQAISTSDQGAQTALTADAIDQMLRNRPKPLDFSHERSLSMESNNSIGTPGTVRIRRSQDSLGSPIASKGKGVDATTGMESRLETTPFRRPGSSGSARASFDPAPPLPANHREAIEAARSGSAGGGQGTIVTSMGPPLWPASAMRHRPRTPSGTKQPMSPTSLAGTPTPRAVRTGSAHGTAEIHSPTKLTHRSRQSSVTSFASEVDTRFNIHAGTMDPTGFGPNTDPRMIQAITQTMIGEYLWKYTRKTGSREMSDNRHRRYFWVHPYTRTLYWSDRDPSSAGRAELKAKSVPIEAVRVVTDDNPMPPGLHRKSLVIIAPGRTVKFTCTTGQRHETWFNALSYLLIRTNNEGQEDAEELAGNITREDVEEFNPSFGRRRANGTRPRPPPSLSSYNSRATRTDSPSIGYSMNIPTLTPTPHKNAAAQRPSLGTLTRLSGYWKSSQVLSGTFSSRRSRSVSGQNPSLYEISQAHDSAEDVRKMIEKQDRESDKMENVRACCDGKYLILSVSVCTMPSLGLTYYV
jgi:hypothetical protein